MNQPALVFAGAGNDKVTTGLGDDLVFGGGGNDKLDGAGGDDVLVGNDGKDDLKGDDGADLLIGGQGKDKLNGGKGDDLLVAGSTDYDDHVSALEALMAEWSGDDNYATRVANVSTGGGSLSGSGVLLNGSTVQDDEDKDDLKGKQHRDLFFYNFAGSGVEDKADVKLSGSQAETRFDL